MLSIQKKNVNKIIIHIKYKWMNIKIFYLKFKKKKKKKINSYI